MKDKDKKCILCSWFVPDIEQPSERRTSGVCGCQKNLLDEPRLVINARKLGGFCEDFKETTQ